MNDELWAANVRIAELQAELRKWKDRARKQRRRADMWSRRARAPVPRPDPFAPVRSHLRRARVS